LGGIWGDIARVVLGHTDEATPDAYNPGVQAELKRRRDSTFWASDYGQMVGRIVVESYDAKRRADGLDNTADLDVNDGHGCDPEHPGESKP